MVARRRISRDEILAEINLGSPGAVDKAHGTDLDHVVALTVLHPMLTPGPKLSHCFQSKTQTAIGLHLPHIGTSCEGKTGHHDLAMTFVSEHWQRQELLSWSLRTATTVTPPRFMLYPIASSHVKRTCPPGKETQCLMNG